ncbi:MAG: hypothetical protein ACTSVV_09900 [Promethearchaeota archaeon]
MIHILTVHWQTDKWIDIQIHYLKYYIKEDFKIYAFLNNISSDHSHKFFYSCTEHIPEHSMKLNLLADMAMLHSNNINDWLMFFDGDAFPIGDIITFAKDKLRKYPLIAIQRRENYLGETFPHPSFCVTTIKFWKETGCNWNRGYLGKFLSEPRYEVGGSLQKKLQDKGIVWYPMLRSNKKNLHPLMFGIYNDLIYHHGAGFRFPAARIDKHNLSIFKRFILILFDKMPNRIKKLKIPYRIFFKRNKKLSENVYGSIINNHEFYRFFNDETYQSEIF